MDDFNIQALTESRNSYANLLLSKLTYPIYQGFEAIFKDTYNLCEENDEEEKYLMTFQNFLARIPNWNQSIVDDEVERIMKECNCSYLEDLLTCVHVTQLKILTSIRVGHKQKEISIDVPSINTFIHNVYKFCARTLYKNAYLYDINIMPLEKQKYKKEVENIIRDEIVNVIRSSMPIESILKAYLDETVEQYDDNEENKEDTENTESTEKKDVIELKPKPETSAETKPESSTELSTELSTESKPKLELSTELSTKLTTESEPESKPATKVEIPEKVSLLKKSNDDTNKETSQEKVSSMSTKESKDQSDNESENENENENENKEETFIGSDIQDIVNSDDNLSDMSDNEDNHSLNIDYDTNTNSNLLVLDDVEELV